jgi:hypothetical protein
MCRRRTLEQLQMQEFRSKQAMARVQVDLCSVPTA